MLKAPKALPLKIENAELRFVSPSKKAAKTLMSIFDFDDNRDFIGRYRPVAIKVKTLGDAVEVFEKARARRMDGTEFEYFIFHNGKMAGNANIFRFDLHNKSAWLGYWLDRRATGKGLASAAVAALEKLGFEKFGLERIVIGCEQDNKASKKVIRRAGYVLEGTERNGAFSAYQNKFVNHLLHSKLKNEYFGEHRVYNFRKGNGRISKT